MNNLLYGQTAYLCGPIDRVADGGMSWRRDMATFLEDLGVIPLDPLNKPTRVGLEDLERRDVRKTWKASGLYDQVADQMKLIRAIDLRLVDLAHFLIVNIDLDVHLAGSYEELFWSNRQKRPVLLHVKQGKMECPDWLFGVLPHEHIFGSWEELKTYLVNIDSGLDTRHFKRWILFDYKSMVPKIPYGGE